MLKAIRRNPVFRCLYAVLTACLFASVLPAQTASSNGPEWNLSTYINTIPGAQNTHIGAVAQDNEGDVFIGGQCDKAAPFIAKLDHSGTFYQWVHVFSKVPHDCTPEAPNTDRPFGIVSALVVDAEGNVSGIGTLSKLTAFPTVNAFRTVPSNPDDLKKEAFAFKLSATGQVEYTTLIGGSQNDFGMSTALDASGGMWVVGVTASPDFARLGAIAECNTTQVNGADVFLMQLDKQGKPLFSSCFGNRFNMNDWIDSVFAAQSDAAGNLYFVGMVQNASTLHLSNYSIFYPKPVNRNTSVYYLARVSAATHTVEYILPLGKVVPLGRGPLSSGSPTYPLSVAPDGSVTTAAFLDEKHMMRDVAQADTDIGWTVVRFDPTGKRTVGPILPDEAGSIALAADGSAYVTGKVRQRSSSQLVGKKSFVLPLFADPIPYILKLNPALQPVWHIELPWGDAKPGVITRGNDLLISNVYRERDLPVTPGAVQRTGVGEETQDVDYLIRLRDPATPGPCKISASPAQLNVANQAPQNIRLFAIASRSDCQWTATSNVPWMKATPGAATTGVNPYKLNIDSNFSGSRTGTLTLKTSDGATATVNVVQTPVACDYQFTPAAGIDFASKNGGTATLHVDVAPDCEWSVKSNADWATLPKGQGKGSADIAVHLTPNPGTVRGSSLEVGGIQIPVVQHTENLAAPSTAGPHSPAITTPTHRKPPVKK
jgi:hypothetical protein